MQDFFCDIRYPDRRRFECDFRHGVQTAVERLGKFGYECKIGAKSEFYLFNLDDNGHPTKIPFDNAGYLDIAPLDKGENIRREICLTLEEMGIQPESSRHKQGPGQNEIDFLYDNPITTADNFITYKSVVKTMAAKSGAHASFMPKPFVDKNGSGFHWHIVIYKDGMNIFEKLTRDAQSFTEGILRRIKDITVFLNPLTNSYARSVILKHRNISPGHAGTALNLCGYLFPALKICGWRYVLRIPHAIPTFLLPCCSTPG